MIRKSHDGDFVHLINSVPIDGRTEFEKSHVVG